MVKKYGVHRQKIDVEKLSKRCHNCGGTEFYMPGDYYMGKPQPLCKRCHPPPEGVKCTEK